MENWSSRRIRELTPEIALRGMAANKIGCARISMMVRSTSSKARPDTLVQDRTPGSPFSLATRGGSIHFGGKLENVPSVLTPVVGLKADIPSPEQLVAVRTPLTPFQDPDDCETMRCVVLTPGGDYETPGVHHASGRRGRNVAARGARAATRADATHRHSRVLRRERSASASPQRGIPARIAAIGLDCRAQRRDRVPLERRQY